MVYDDGLTRDDWGKRTDKTGTRNLAFNYWHRKFLSNKCYTTDIDFYEYRIVSGKFQPKALVEVKQFHVKQKKYLASANIKALYELAKRANIRFFIVLYEPLDEVRDEKDPPPFRFWLWEPKSKEDIESYNEEQFERFFQKMDNDKFIDFMENL